MGPFTWLGRMILWIVFFPLGIWRSLRHHRKKAENRAVRRMRKEMRGGLG